MSISLPIHTLSSNVVFSVQLIPVFKNAVLAQVLVDHMTKQETAPLHLMVIAALLLQIGAGKENKLVFYIDRLILPIVK
jgi:hypothetical protein